MFIGITYGQVSMLTGLEGETYNQFANNIKSICSVPFDIYTTGASIDNFSKMTSKSSKPIISFMQYDVLIYKELENQKIKDNLRVLFSLYNEEIHLITKNNNKISKLSDLEGKRVAIGSQSQGSVITSYMIKNKTSINWIDVKVAFNDAFAALLNDQIDAFFYVGGAPVNTLKQLSPEVSNIIKLVPIEDSRLEGIYTKTNIKANTYPWANYDVPTYSVKSVMVVNRDNLNANDRSIVSQIIKDVRININKLKTQQGYHPKWGEFNLNDKVSWKYYEEN